MSTEVPYDRNSEQYRFVARDLAKASMDPNIRWIIVSFHRPMYFLLEEGQREQVEPGDEEAEEDIIEEKEPMSDIYHPLFDRYGVNLVLYAHIHTYDRSYPLMYNGTSTAQLPLISDNSTNLYYTPVGQIYATVGTAGAYLHGQWTKTPFIVSEYEGHGFLDIEVLDNGTTLMSRFYANDGTIRDQFSITNPYQKCNDTCKILLS
jgi:hypothetical protein